MTDLSGVPSFGGGGFAIRIPPEPRPPAVPEVTSGGPDGARNAPARRDSRGGAADEALAQRRIVARIGLSDQDTPTRSTAADKRFDPDIIPGPTPAFQATLLELESDLQTVIARLEAARSHAQDSAAIAPVPVAQLSQTSEASAARAETSTPPSTESAETPGKTPPPPAVEAAQITRPGDGSEAAVILPTPYDVTSAPGAT